MNLPTRTALVALLALGAGCGDEPAAPGVRADASPDTAADVAQAPDASPDVAAAPDATPDAPAAMDAPVAMDAPAPDAPADAPTDRAATPDARDAADAADDRGMMATVGPYPAGPYGINEGQTLANLNWEGYTNLDGAVVSTMLPFAPTSMQAVRETGRAYALVHVSEFY
ncbi:MAG: hypothetical protein U0324_14260 [Polyangiales bacterium]